MSESLPAQTRPTGWALVWRYGLAIIYAALTWLVLIALQVSGQQEVTMRPALVVADVVLGTAALLLIRFRHRYPILTAVVMLAMATFASSASLVSGWALVHVATRRRWREVLPLAAAGTVLSMLSVMLQLQVFRIVNTATMPVWAVFLQTLAWTVLGIGISIAVGFSLGARRDLLASLRQRAEDAERNQELMVLQGQSAERNRIAREMHDVLAHRISLVSMHAGVLAYRTDLSADQTQEIASLIQENAHQSLTELRTVLGTLRQDGPEPADGEPAPVEKPQPTMHQVGDLVADARNAGEKIDFVNEVEHPELLPALTGRHAYRVVQEALTNARKHAPHARVTLELSGRPGEGLVIRCTNPLSTGTAGLPGAGLGLLGLAERAQVMGGRIGHGVTDDRRFALEVWLPW
ncbi:sensor histidine kinase [Aestuariimicrobium soli]|uniref:sensor histidine kinase n=1 Tax=Aestuariimicrobium soli TaxID=2035834 RepID=UPI003EBD7206